MPASDRRIDQRDIQEYLRRADRLQSGLDELRGSVARSVAPVEVTADNAQTTATSKTLVIRTITAPEGDQRAPQNLWLPPDTNTPHAYDPDLDAWTAIPDQVATEAAADAANAVSRAQDASDAAADANASAADAVTKAQQAKDAAASAVQSASDASTAASSAGSKAQQAYDQSVSASSTASSAQDAASAAQTAAAGKSKVIVQPSAPSGVNADPQNLWIDTSADANGNPKNQPNRYNSSTSKWEPVTDLVASTASSTATTALSNAATADGKAVAAKTAADNAQTKANQASTDAATAAGIAGGKADVLIQSATPASSFQKSTTLWIDTTSNANTPKRWTGSAWEARTDKAATDAASAAASAQTSANTAKSAADTAQSRADAAYAAAGTAQTTADGKGKTIVQASAPTGANATAANLWVDISTDASGSPRNQPNRWNPSSSKWEPISDLIAQNAATVAASASSAASAAQTSATGAQQTADQARTDAATAQSKANQASTDAASAAGIATGKADVLIQSATPAAAMQKATTLWIDTTNNANVPKRWNGSAWEARTDKTATDAASAAAAAQTQANTATTNAATAQSAANAAQTKANQATSDAAAAQSTANTAVTNAATAQSAADTAKAAADVAAAKAVAVAGGVLTNGGAEFDFDSWDASSKGTIAVQTTKVRSGSKAWQANATGEIRQGMFAVKPGDTWRYRWWAQAVNTGTGAVNGGLRLQKYDANASSPGWSDAGSSTAPTTNVFTMQELNYTVPASGVTHLRARIAFANASGVTVYFDDIELVNITDAKAASDAAASAASAASTAQSTANQAKTDAATAQSAANAAASAASTAQTTANSKTRVMSGTGAPTSDGTALGDLWFTIPNASTGIITGQYRWDGSSWVQQTVDSAVLASVDAGKITSGYIAAARIQAGTITGTMIAADTVTATQIAANAVTASELAAGAVTAGKIAAGTIVANDIASGTITGDRLTAGTIGAGQIAAGAVTTVKLAAGAVTANEIASGTITSDRIAGGTIQGDRMAANTLTATQIAAGAIGTGQLAAGAVTAAKITAGTITGDRIAGGTITGSLIAGNTVAAKNMTVGDFTNLVDDADFTTPLGTVWNTGTGRSIVAVTDGPDGYAGNVLQQVANGSVQDMTQTAFSVTPGEQWYAVVAVRATAAANGGTVQLAATITTASGLSYPTFASVNPSTLSTTAWTKLSGTITVPTGATKMTIRLSVRNDVTAGTVQFAQPRMRRLNGGELIVDGAITTNKIVANAITGAKIAADTITAANIASGAVQADEIAASAVTADKIAANAITAAHISAGAIQTDDLAANAVTAAKIAAGTITGDRMAANSVTAREIQSGSITADLLSANAIDGKTITGATVRTGSSGQRAVLGGSLISFYDQNDSSAGVIEGLPNGAAGGMIRIGAVGSNGVGASFYVGSWSLPNGGSAAGYAPTFWIDQLSVSDLLLAGTGSSLLVPSTITSALPANWGASASGSNTVSTFSFSSSVARPVRIKYGSIIDPGGGNLGGSWSLRLNGTQLGIAEGMATPGPTKGSWWQQLNKPGWLVAGTNTIQLIVSKESASATIYGNRNTIEVEG